MYHLCFVRISSDVHFTVFVQPLMEKKYLENTPLLSPRKLYIWSTCLLSEQEKALCAKFPFTLFLHLPLKFYTLSSKYLFFWNKLFC